jgi:RNA 2',3'-cyclic 3'-phosphodiesterase
MTAPPEAMRAFIALNLDAGSVRKLGALSRRLGEGRGAPKLRWVAPTQMHLTLKFLGSIDAGRAPALVDALRPLADARLAPRAALAALSAFPSLENARVVVVLIDDIEGGIANLARDVDQRAMELGFEREAREYRPHVTLARTRDALDLRAWLDDATLAREEVTVTELVLYRSDQVRSGVEYTALARFAFGSPSHEKGPPSPGPWAGPSTTTEQPPSRPSRL